MIRKRYHVASERGTPRATGAGDPRSRPAPASRGLVAGHPRGARGQLPGRPGSKAAKIAPVDGAGAARARDPGGQRIGEVGLSRNVLMTDGPRKAEAMVDHAYLLFRRLKDDAAPLPDYFVEV